MRPVKGRSHRGWFPSTFVVRCDKNGNQENGVGGGSDPNKAAAAVTVKQPPPLYPLINSHQGSVGALGTPFHVSSRAWVCAAAIAYRACYAGGGNSRGRSGGVEHDACRATGGGGSRSHRSTPR